MAEGEVEGQGQTHGCEPEQAQNPPPAHTLSGSYLWHLPRISRAIRGNLLGRTQLRVSLGIRTFLKSCLFDLRFSHFSNVPGEVCTAQ